MEVNPNTIVSSASLVVAIVALTLNNRYASLRDQRKEFRGRLEDILDKTSDLESLAVKFHTSESHDEIAADEINWKLDRLSKHIQSISVFKADDVSQAYINYKKSISSTNFGASRFSQQKANSEIVRDIHAMSSRLTIILMKKYDSKHPLK